MGKIFKEVAEVVLRNTVTRKDAAYVVCVLTDSRHYRVIGYWGTWANYEDGKLRSTVKKDGTGVIGARLAAAEIIEEKVNKGYEVQPDLSWGPLWIQEAVNMASWNRVEVAVAKPEPKPDPPKPGQPITHVRFLEF